MISNLSGANSTIVLAVDYHSLIALLHVAKFVFEQSSRVQFYF